MPKNQPPNYDTDSSSDSDAEYLRSQRDWEESLQQVQLLINAVLLPFVGKWLGRKWSYWVCARYLRMGFAHALLGIKKNLAQ